ncbi:hypothetical protein [Clostridium sp.]|uniref:hypothetical protein n=1 Tax=Clostridium sp. TaxID=1506 RepID=UPI003D6D9EE8
MAIFNEVYNKLVEKGPTKVISSRGTEYKVEARNGNIIAFPKSGRLTIHEDCWGKAITCRGQELGGYIAGPTQSMIGIVIMFKLFELEVLLWH